MQEPPHDAVDRTPLLRALKACLPAESGSVNWPAIERMTSDSLVTSLAMFFPFAPSEKQALLEAPSTEDRARILITLMAMMAVTGGAGWAESRPQ